MSSTRNWTRSAAFLTASLAWLACGSVSVADDGKANKEEAQPTKIAVFDAAVLEVPADWKPVAPRSRIIQHEFAVGDGEDADSKARLTMMAAGGNVEANIARWKGQLTGGPEEAQKTEKLEVAGHTVHLVHLSGTYTERMGGGPFAPGPTVKRPDYAMAGAIIVDPNQRKFFVKMIGPESIVKENREAFEKMIKGMKKT